MAGLFAFLLISMFFLGIVQILVGLGILVSTKKEVVRKHLIMYFGGVVAYFLVLSLFKDVDHASAYPPLLIAFFFSGAISLALYQLVIVIAPDKLK